jgi:hypothetical protein
LQFSGAVSEFIIEDLYNSMTLYVSMLFYPLYEVAKRCDCKIKLFHDPTVFDIQYSLLQNNKLEIEL